MSIETNLYGDLKQKIESKKNNRGIPLKLYLNKSENTDAVYDILRILKIKPREISHIFVNGKYCGPGKQIKAGDRIGLFPKNMGLNFVEIEQNNPISVKIRLSEDINEPNWRRKLRLNIPEGSNIEFLLDKLIFTLDTEKLEIRKNGKKIEDLKSIVHDGDSIIISS